MLRIEVERKKLGLTQTELGAKCKISYQDISRIENGWLKPYNGMDERIKKTFGIASEVNIIDEIDETDEEKTYLVNKCKFYEYKNLSKETLRKIIDILKEVA